MKQIKIDRRSQLMQGVCDAVSGKLTRTNQRLSPEPQGERNRGNDDASEEASPVTARSGIGGGIHERQ